MRARAARQWAVVAAAAWMLGCGADSQPREEPSDTPDFTLLTGRVDMGRTVAGGYLEGVLRLKAGPEGAVLTQVAPSCGCTVSLTPVPVVLGPHQTFDARLALDLSRLADHGASQDASPRLIERTVAIASRSGADATAVVSAEVSSRMTITPAQVRFPVTLPRAEAWGEIVVTGSGGRLPPRVVAARSSRDDVTAGVTSATDTESRVAIAWAPDSAGEMAGWLTLQFEDQGEPPTMLRVTGEARPLVTVTPERIENLEAATNRPVEAVITLFRTDDAPLEIVSATSSEHRSEVRVEDGDGPVRVVRAIIPVLAPPAEMKGTILLRTDAPGAEALKVPFHVRAKK